MQEFSSRMEAVKALTDYLALEYPDIRVGQFVELAIHGQYSLPKGNQAAQCVEKFSPRLSDESNDVVDMTIAVAVARGIIKFFHADSRHYRAVNEQRGRLFNFGRRE